MGMTLDEARRRDKDDPLRGLRDAFLLPDGVIYLDGNSLGPLPRAAADAVARTVRQDWGQGLIGSWTSGPSWMDWPRRIGGKIARIIGAEADEVVVADSTSVNLFKLMVAALRAQAERPELLLEEGDFPTDLYMAEAAARFVPGTRVVVAARADILSRMGQDTALVVLCHVHYRSGARHDMAAVEARARETGALVLWDLSHSAGAVPVALDACGASLAVGCGYKFLNGGPGAPAFLYVSRRVRDGLETPLPGWMGHAAPFDFAARYAPAGDAARFACGTPPVLGLAALEAGVDVFLHADCDALFAKSGALFAAFQDGVGAGLDCLTPTDARARGSHIAFRHERADDIIADLAKRGVVGDFRPPDLMRFGLTPLYTGFGEIHRAAEMVRACAIWRQG